MVLTVARAVKALWFEEYEVEVARSVIEVSGWKSITLGTEKSAGVLVIPSLANLLDWKAK
jgi:hypothetical protein